MVFCWKRRPLKILKRVKSKWKVVGVLLALVVLSLAILSASREEPYQASEFQNGDIIFHTSRSNQSYAIMWASKSLLSHVGLIEVDGDDVFVVEAIGKVSRTPLAKWIARGRLGKYELYRPNDLDPLLASQAVDQAKSYLGRKYDLYFTSDNDEIYCSELIELAYQKARVSLGQFQTVSDLDIDNPIVRRLVQQRWRKHPKCADAKDFDQCWNKILKDKLVTPVSIARDSKLTLIKSTY